MNDTSKFLEILKDLIYLLPEEKRENAICLCLFFILEVIWFIITKSTESFDFIVRFFIKILHIFLIIGVIVFILNLIRMVIFSRRKSHDETKNKKTEEKIIIKQKINTLKQIKKELLILKHKVDHYIELGPNLNLKESNATFESYSDIILKSAVELENVVNEEIIDSLKELATYMEDTKNMRLYIGCYEEYKQRLDKINEICSLLLEKIKKEIFKELPY